MRGPRLSRLRLHLLDAGFALAELVVLLSPLGPPRRWPVALLLLGAVLLGGAALVWSGALVRWLRPLRVAAARGDLEEVEQATVQLGWPALRLRAALALCIGVPLAVLGRTLDAAPPAAPWLVLWAALLYVPHVDALRALLAQRLLRRALRPGGALRDDALRGLGGRYRGELMLVALATGVPAMLALVGLTRFFVPLSPAQQERVQLVLPPVLLALLVLFGLWLLGRTRSLDAYLAAAASTEQPVEQEAARAYRAAQLLPYVLGLSKVALWLVAALVLGLCGTRLWGLDAESAVLLLGETVLVSLGAALYEVPWHRATLAPLIAHLARERRQGIGQRHLSLRSKMLIAFGALTLFACGLSLLWAVMQYRAVASSYIQRLNRLRLEELLAELREHPPDDGADLERLLRGRARDEVLIYHYRPAGRPPGRGPGDLRGYAARGPAPPLPPAGIGALRSGQRGQLDLPALRLSASYGPLRLPGDAAPARADWGAVLIAQPSYRGGGFDTEARLLLGFFVLLLVGALGAVVLTAADLTRPIRGLQRMADAIARGDLDPPTMPVGLEGDEVGRLYAAFEEMRRALRERFRSSTEVHFALEAQVARRTAELERRNRERKEALEALERAQEELVHAEKMASLGRLVAGIAHEINNPVNAVVNTAVPLSEALTELSERVAREPDEAALRQALGADLEELRSMLRVIQRGARRTKEIVQTLHNYARSDGAELGQVDVHRCLLDTLDLLQHDLKRGIQVERDLGELGPVEGNVGQLQQVFLNLLTNAVQALGERASAPPGSPAEPPRVCIVTRQQNGRAVITISDNGPGIPPEVLPRIFDPFFTTKDVGQGSGLGLSIVHSIVQRHGGSISVDSALHQGTAVTVTLPLWTPPLLAGAPREERKKPGPAA